MKQFSQRQLQVAENIKRSLGEIFLKEDIFLKNSKKTANITVTLVEITPDLKNATVFFYTLNALNSSKEVLLALEELNMELRKKLAKKLALRFLPQIKFVWDDVLEKAMNLSDKIKG
jgi:ribosome-binding factor A